MSDAGVHIGHATGAQTGGGREKFTGVQSVAGLFFGVAAGGITRP